MNKTDFARSVAATMRANNIKRTVPIPKKVFHISDDDGNGYDFAIPVSDKHLGYTVDDVETIIDVCMEVIKELMIRGENLTIHGYGRLSTRLSPSKMIKMPGRDEFLQVPERYMIKFAPGVYLREAVAQRTAHMNEARDDEVAPVYDESDEEDYFDDEEYLDEASNEEEITEGGEDNDSI